MKIILPEYCGACGEKLEGNFTCEYCGEEVLYPKKYMQKVNEEYERTKKKKMILIVASVIAIFFVISFLAKSVTGNNATASNAKQEKLIITKEPTPKPTKKPTPEPTEEPTLEPTEEPTMEPTKEPTLEPTAKPTKKPTSKPMVITEAPVVVTKKTEVTKKPVPEHIYATSLSLPKVISMKLGNSISVPVTYSPGNAEITIISGSNDIVVISGRTMKAKGKGSCTITVRSGNKSATCRVMVTQ